MTIEKGIFWILLSWMYVFFNVCWGLINSKSERGHWRDYINGYNALHMDFKDISLPMHVRDV